MDMTRWLNEWLARHPLREPPALDQARFTAEVMARVKAPEPAARFQLVWPQVRAAVFAAAAAVFMVVWLRGPAAPGDIAWMAERELSLLASVDDVADVLPVNHDAQALEEELRLMDRFRLAEAEATDAEWIEHTLQLLDDVGEADTDRGVESLSEEELLRELELLERQDLAASS